MERPPPEPPLTTDLLLLAYSRGYFPMAEGRTGPLSWYSPDPRAVIPIETFHPSRSLRQLIRKRIFEVRIDEAFGEVLRACADREETWISEGIIAAYAELHREGHAHSVETRRDGILVGGLYGIAIGGAFFGESMFSREPSASKVALAALVERLRERGFLLLDAQFMNEHLRQFGTVEIPRDEYLRRLGLAMRVRISFHG
jgi:leucyl/phenylalanyl-tRNA--protein transferase